MKLVEAIDKCIGNSQLSPRSGSDATPEPSPPPQKAVVSPSRSVKFSTPPMPTKSELSGSPAISSKSEPAIPEIKSDAKSWRNRGESSSSTQSEGAKLVQSDTKLLQKKSSKAFQKQDTEVSFLDYAVYDSHRKKVTSLSLDSSLLSLTIIFIDFAEKPFEEFIISDLRHSRIWKLRFAKCCVWSLEGSYSIICHNYCDVFNEVFDREMVIFWRIAGFE
jgi:hypothetical protein